MTNSIATLPVAEIDYDPKWDEKFYTDPGLYDRSIEYPKISIVIPSYNQGKFIERTIRCILLQNYPNIQIVVVDGRSCDSSLKVINKYLKYISHLIYEQDTGMYDAINKGFAITNGDVMAWSPTGDLYVSGALELVGRSFFRSTKFNWITTSQKVSCSENLKIEQPKAIKGFSKRAFMHSRHMPGHPNCDVAIHQQSTFWTKKLWIKAGSFMDENLKYGGDFELWCRFFDVNEILYTIDKPIGIFMKHEGQASQKHYVEILKEQVKSISFYGGKEYYSKPEKLVNWLIDFIYRFSNGRIPLPPSFFMYGIETKEFSIKKEFYNG